MPVPLQVGADLAKTSARDRVGVHTSVHYDSITDNDNDYKTDRNKKRKTNHYTQNHTLSLFQSCLTSRLSVRFRHAL